MRGGFDTLQFPPPENACVLGGNKKNGLLNRFNRPNFYANAR